MHKSPRLVGRSSRFLQRVGPHWAARLIEHWQTSFILNMGTGTPASIGGAGTMRYGNPRYVVTSDWKLPHGHAAWNGPGGNTGTYFGNNYVTRTDPQCSDTTQVAPSLAGFCTLNALAMKVPAGTPGATTLSDGRSVVNVLVNPKPGEIGTLGNCTFDGPGVFFLDGNISTSFRLSETKTLSIRLDATNILNHPQPNAPQFHPPLHHAIRPNRRQGHYNFRPANSCPAELPGTSAPHILGFFADLRWKAQSANLRTEN